MSIAELPQLPLNYAHRVSSRTFLITSLDGLLGYVHQQFHGNPLAGYIASYYLLVAIALLWAHPESLWYRPGCWLQPTSGRNAIFCGPTSVLRRFRLLAARLGLCLTESCQRQAGTGAIPLQCYWALPDNVWMDMAQLELLSFRMPVSASLPDSLDGQGGFSPYRIDAGGPTEYITTLMGLTGSSPGLYLAVRRRNHALASQHHRIHPRVLECLALCTRLSRSESESGPLVALFCSRMSNFLGLAEEDHRIYPATRRSSSYHDQVLEQDRRRCDRSMFELDVEYLDDLDLLALGSDSDDDEGPLGPNNSDDEWVGW